MTGMGESPRLPTLLAVSLLVAGLAGVAAAAPGGVMPASGVAPVGGAELNGTAATNDTTADAGPGPELAGAFGAERATLDGEFRSGTYRVRLQRAETRAELVAVLRDVGTDLESRLAALERRQDRLAGGGLPAGEAAHLSRTTSVEATVLARLAASGERVADVVGADHDLRGLFADLAGRADDAVNRTGGTAVPETISLEGDDWPGLSDGESGETLDSLNRSDIRINESALESADAAALLTLADSSLIDVEKRVLPTARNPEPIDGDAVTINESALSDVDRQELLALRATGVVEIDALRTNATAAGGEAVDPIRGGEGG